MRDPGTPRRNPFFEHGSDGTSDDFGMGWRDGENAAAEPSSESAMPDGAAGGFAMLLALVEALGDAQPEAAEHLVAAAHEVVLTVKVLVDATEAVLAQQRDAMAARNAMRSDAGDAPASGPDSGVPPVSMLRRDEAR